MTKYHPGVPLAALALCLFPLLAVRAGAQSVPLANGVARDAHMVIHGRTSQTPDPAAVALEKALGGLIESGIHEDILDLATMGMPTRKAERVRQTFHHVVGLLGKTDWNDLMGREVVFVETFGVPMPEYTLLCRVPEDRVSGHLADLREMFAGFAQMIGDELASVEEVERRTGKMVVFRVERAPVQLAAGAVGDVIVLSSSTSATTAAMRRLAGGGKGSLEAEERYQESMRQLPPGTEGTFYLNVDGLMGFLSQGLQLAAGAVGRDPRSELAVALCRELVEELDVVDHLASSTASDGRTVTSTTLIRLKPDYQDSIWFDLCGKQQPWTEWYRYVPENATGFAFDSGVDVAGMLDWFTELAVDCAGGPDNAPWAQSRLYARVREIAGHLSGEAACITFPQVGEAGCACGETVVLLRLEKTDGVAEWLRDHLRHFASYAGRRGQEVEVASRDDLNEIVVSALPWIRPVVGVRDGMIVLATSPAALEQLARVQSGEARDIRSSERFAELGVGKGGHYFDYYQQDASLGQFSNLVSGVGFLLALLPADRETRPAIKLGAILTKLAPALRQLDMSLDVGSDVLPSENPEVVMSRRVVRYR